MKAAIGVAIVAAHAAGFVAFAPSLRGVDLVVELAAPLASPELHLEGKVPVEIADRVKTTFATEAPGLVRKRWSVEYRGGFRRAVGATQLVGPFQDPSARACVGRIVVGQALLDDGSASLGTIGGEMRKQIHAAMKGLSVFGIGDFERVGALSLRWAQLEKHPEDKKFVKAAPIGYVRATATIVFDRVEVPLVVALIPKALPNKVEFDVKAAAKLDFDNRFIQWASDKLGGDKLATKFTNQEIDAALITTLQPPPPFALPDGQELRFGYCDGLPEIVDGAYGAIPFGIAFERNAADPAILPPKRGPALHATIAPKAALAVDLDLDALNALLYELWRTKLLDKKLAEAKLDERFNADPIVTEFLTLRIKPLTLALPPVMVPHGSGMRLGAEGRIAISDGTKTTTGRVWGELDFRFAEALADPKQLLSVDVGSLELSCERTPTSLVPCYADLVGAIADKGKDFHGELTEVFAALVTEIFVNRRLGGEGMPADLVIESTKPSVATSGNGQGRANASLHFDIQAKLVPPE